MKLEALLGLLRAAFALRRCDRGDHAWRYEPARHVHGRTYGPYRMCPTCFAGLVLATEPPADHPDSVAGDLPASLAALDSQFCSEETR